MDVGLHAEIYRRRMVSDLHTETYHILMDFGLHTQTYRRRRVLGLHTETYRRHRVLSLVRLSALPLQTCYNPSHSCGSSAAICPPVQ